MQNKIAVKKIFNPFNPIKEQGFDWVDYRGETLLDLRNQYFPTDIDVVVSLNGGIVPVEELGNIRLKEGDFVLFKPYIAGGGDDLLRVVAMLALVAIAIAVPYALGMYTLTAEGAFGGFTLAGSLLSAGIMTVGGFLINTLLPPTLPGIDDASGFDNSNAYSWHSATQQKQGIVIPKIYGITKVYGNIISVYQEVIGIFGAEDNFDFEKEIEKRYGFKRISDKNYINVLLGLGYGPVVRLYDYYINNQPAGNFDNVDIHTRYGLLNQEIIPNFNNTKTQYTTNVKCLYNDPYTYETTGDAFDGLEVDITFPRGLFFYTDEGALNPMSVDIQILIKKQGDSYWIPITQQTLSTPTTVTTSYWSKGRWIYNNYWGVESNEWVEIEKGSTNPSEHYDGEYAGVEYYNEAEYSGCYPLFWRWVTGNITKIVEKVVDYVTITDAKNSTIVKTFKSDVNLPHGKYDIKVTRLTADYSSSRYGADTYLTAVREVVCDDFTYPRQVLVGLKAMASDQLSGSLDFSCMCQGSKVVTYTDGVQKFQHSNNPAWVCLDILTQPVFTDAGVFVRYDGIDISRIDIPAFEAWAAWCDALVDDGKGGTEKRFEFNGIFDAEVTMWEAAVQVATMSRALLIWNGTTISVVIDKKVDLNTVSCLFSMGNIKQDSFRETFLSLEERVGELEINFIDSDSGYEKGTFTVFDADLDKPTNKTTITAIGTTKASQAWRIGKYMLAKNRLLQRTIQFEADIDAISVGIGDPFFFAHDVPQWGLSSGRVVSSTNSSVTIDKTVTIEAGKSYAITVWKGDNTIETKTVTNSPGEYETLTISGTWNGNPDAYNSRYTFGESDTQYKPFITLDVSRTSDLTCTINAIEYQEGVYAVDTGTPELPAINYSRLSPIEPVTDLEVVEKTGLNESGVIVRSLLVTFKKPDNVGFRQAHIFYKEYPLGNYMYAGSTITEDFSINNVKPLTEYQVVVVSESYLGIKTSFSESPSYFVTTSGLVDITNYVFSVKVSGLHIDGYPNSNEFVGKDCKFVWNSISEIDTGAYGADQEPLGAGHSLPPVWFKDYEVKILDSSGKERRTEYVYNNYYTYTFEKNYEDGNGNPVRKFEIQIRVRDKFGRISKEPAKLLVSNTAPRAVSGVSVLSGTGYFIVEFTPSTEPDILGYKVYASQTSGFTPDISTIVSDGVNTRVVLSPPLPGVWYIRVAAYDTFGVISLNFSPEYSVNVASWLEHDDIELEFMKMSFNSVSWAQFAIFDDFVLETKREVPEPFTYKATRYKNSIVASGNLANTIYGWTSKTYQNATTIETGTSTSVGLNFLTDTSKNWYTNEVKGLTLVDSNSNTFLILSNTDNTITVSGTPSAGAYQLKDDNPSYMVCFCSYEDSTESGGSGFVKMEVSFDGGTHWQTVLDTEHGIDLLEGTIAIDYPGTDYKVRFSLKTDSNGNSPVVKKYLVCTDPSCWRY